MRMKWLRFCLELQKKNEWNKSFTFVRNKTKWHFVVFEFFFEYISCFRLKSTGDTNNPLISPPNQLTRRSGRAPVIKFNDKVLEEAKNRVTGIDNSMTDWLKEKVDDDGRGGHGKSGNKVHSGNSSYTEWGNDLNASALGTVIKISNCCRCCLTTLTRALTLPFGRKT